jgi:class 3 adenylate cyclase/tetratricopeptide (TPR) repeat protein
VVFADLVASTELATRLDPEDLREVYRPYFEAMTEEVVRHGGSVEKFIGDAVVGVFGAPIAHGDDPVRAVRAALAMQERIPDLNRRLASKAGGELALRVAVDTGEVLASPGAEHQAMITGETTTLAARLQGVAAPNGVVVSERTHRDTRRQFDFEPLDEVTLKGVARPVRVWRVLGVGGSEPSVLVSPLVGRRDELELLALLLRRCAKEDHPYVATIVGAAGIGKSRLAEEFAARVVPAAGSDASTGGRVVTGRCLAYGDGLRLWPLGEILKDDVGILDSDPPGTILERAISVAGRRFADDPTGSTVSILLSSVGIPVTPDPLAGAGREAAERMIADAWARYLGTLALDGPLVAVIEDIHWADGALLDLLERLAARTAAPVLFMCLARPEVFDRRPEWGAGSANFATLELSPLSPTEETALVENLFDHEAPPELIAAIAGRAEGNPFFAGELLRMLVEDGTIERRDGTWTMNGELPADLPDTVLGAIAARIDRLRPAEKRAIQDAAVVGRVFWDGTLDALGTEDPATQIDALIARGLIRRHPESSLAGARELSFQHALIRDVAYAGIPRARRSRAHGAVLEWMERLTSGRDEEFAELMAHHATEAGDAERTARAATLAGHRHRRVYAAEDAIAWYERALAAADALPADRTRSLLSELLHSRGEALEQLSRFDEALADYERALAIARETGRAWLEAQVLAAIAHVQWMQDRYAEGEELLPVALEAAREAGMPNLEARLLYTAGALAWARGDWTRALECHEQALAIALGAGDLEGEAYARHGLTDTRCFLGPLEEAHDQSIKARELWRRLGQRPMQHHNDLMLGYVCVLLGRFDEAEETLVEAVVGTQELGQRRDETIALAARMFVELARGDVRSALATINDAVTTGRTVDAPRPAYIAVLFRMLLLAELGGGRLARRDLPLAAELSRQVGPLFHPPLISVRGWLELDAGDRDAAVASFDEARREAEAGLFHELLCGRVEICAWEAATDPAGLRDAGVWLLAAADGSSRPLEALAAWAIARADELDGRPDEEAARRALDLAERAGDATVLWRACALVAHLSHDERESATLRARAAEIVRGMAASMADPELREAFLARPQVLDLVQAEDPGGTIRRS